MTNPYLSAFIALGYISAVVLVIFYGGQLLKDAPETILIPIAMLSLFVLSAAVMGYLFLAQPAMLYFDGKKQEGLHFFLKTVGVFAVFTTIALAAVLVTAYAGDIPLPGGVVEKQRAGF